MSSTPLADARSCQTKGAALVAEQKHREARAWFEQGLRVLNSAKTRLTGPAKKQFQANVDALKSELYIAISSAALLSTPPNQLAALETATRALDTSPDNEAAMLARARAFAAEGPWQSLSRFEAERDKILHLYPNSTATATILAEIPLPPAVSDQRFGDLPARPPAADANGVTVSTLTNPDGEGPAPEDEDPADAEARKNQGRIRERMAASFSTNLDWHASYKQGRAPAPGAAAPATSGRRSAAAAAAANAAAARAGAGAAGKEQGCGERVKQARARCNARMSQIVDGLGAWLSGIVANAIPGAAGGGRRR